MANTLGVYNPIFYAQEALIQLEKALGMAGRVHRGYDSKPSDKGDTISIRKPGTFSAADAPASASNITTTSVDIVLDQWREVKFGLTDKELSHTKEDIIREHIRPAAYALADDLDQKLVALSKKVPYFDDVAGGAGSTIVLADIASARKTMFDNQVPLRNGDLSLMVGGAEEAALLPLLSSQNLGSGGSDVLSSGVFGNVFGFDIFANQNVTTHTKGTLDNLDLFTNGTPAAGAQTMSIDDTSVAGTLVEGDTFVIAGQTQRYAVTALATASANAITIFFEPGLVAAPGDGIAVTVDTDNHVENMAFHRNAIALATAPLSEMGNELGANIATVSSPESNLSLRSRLYYEGANSKVFVALDILFGYKVLDHQLFTKLRG